jgi:hypothetical protein
MEYIRTLNFQAHLPCEALEVAILDYANSNFARGSSLRLPRTICPSLFLSRFYTPCPSFAHCRSPDCMINYGTCDTDKSPIGPPTKEIPRPHIG